MELLQENAFNIFINNFCNNPNFEHKLIEYVAKNKHIINNVINLEGLYHIYLIENEYSSLNKHWTPIVTFSTYEESHKWILDHGKKYMDNFSKKIKSIDNNEYPLRLNIIYNKNCELDTEFDKNSNLISSFVFSENDYNRLYQHYDYCKSQIGYYNLVPKTLYLIDGVECITFTY